MKEETVGELSERMTDAQLITYCSSHAQGSAMIHLLCDRLTEANMRQQAIRHKLEDLIELSGK